VSGRWRSALDGRELDLTAGASVPALLGELPVALLERV
jgi:hypothetical protein